eukprot:CAMPEP_0169231738 /NCGR_PEP_ID=MMETSP1016-20121227/26673_1 /TAXON_ID=342587 /ORGANISM="Karlodinium micrum, Strain CCMP2283" /LENGTH=50 /DNA_ID=CAMNT_0009310895 /DNA_START=20 /DNA_END=168 /DNA_ORIENTATION=+
MKVFRATFFATLAFFASLPAVEAGQGGLRQEVQTRSVPTAMAGLEGEACG